LLVLRGARIADVVDVERQRLGEIVEPEELQLRVTGGLGQLLLPLKQTAATRRPRNYVTVFCRCGARQPASFSSKSCVTCAPARASMIEAEQYFSADSFTARST